MSLNQRRMVRKINTDVVVHRTLDLDLDQTSDAKPKDEKDSRKQAEL